MFDSCIHFQKNSFNYIEKISKKLSLNKINYALAMYDSEKKITDRIKFKKNCEKFNNLIPVAFLRNSKNIKSEINNIVKLKYKFIKIHPRILRKSLSDVKFYTKVFNELKKTNLSINVITKSNCLLVKNLLSKFTNKRIAIKKPNDLLIDKKKISGILQEVILIKGKKFLITGIGINIIKNPNIKNYTATNLQDVAKKSISKLKVENKLKHIFEKNLLKL